MGKIEKFKVLYCHISLLENRIKKINQCLSNFKLGNTSVNIVIEQFGGIEYINLSKEEYFILMRVLEEKLKKEIDEEIFNEWRIK